jgi:DNA-directed RNA polymerase subunit M/transcription elongation factor TFIIS
MRFCPYCKNLLIHTVKDKGLTRSCNCGYEEEDKEGGLVVETIIQERASESYKILLNEFTRHDPTLPHTKEIKCPNESCPSNRGGGERDVILIKYDKENLKFIYMCNKDGCLKTWRSRS